MPAAHPGSLKFIFPIPDSVIQSHPWISIIIIGLAVRPVVVVLHELGHATIATFFARQKIAIFLGSYGNRERSANVKFGSWEIWFIGNPFLWQCGACIPSFPITNANYRTSYFLAGPILPVAISAIMADAAVFFHFGEYTTFVILVFFAVSVVDMIFNLIPFRHPLTEYENTPVFTDGYSLRLALLQRKYPLEFFTAISQYSKHQYADAARNFERALRRMPGNKVIDKNLQECYRFLAEDTRR